MPHGISLSHSSDSDQQVELRLVTNTASHAQFAADQTKLGLEEQIDLKQALFEKDLLSETGTIRTLEKRVVQVDSDVKGVRKDLNGKAESSLLNDLIRRNPNP